MHVFQACQFADQSLHLPSSPCRPRAMVDMRDDFRSFSIGTSSSGSQRRKLLVPASILAAKLLVPGAGAKIRCLAVDPELDPPSKAGP